MADIIEEAMSLWAAHHPKEVEQIRAAAAMDGKIQPTDLVSEQEPI